MSVLSEIYHEHIDYQKQTLKMAKTDLVRTYRGSALGWSWAVIKPVITIFIYWFAMSMGLRHGKPHGDYIYFLWLIFGMVPWFYCSDMMHRGTECMRKYRYLITKIHYPVSTIPTFVSLSNLFVETVLLAVVYVISLIMGHPPTLYHLQIFFYLFLAYAFFTSWSLFAAPISAISEDFSNLIKSIVFAFLWISGIFFDIDDLENQTIAAILKINPIAYLVKGFREAFMSEAWFWEHPVRLAIFLAELLIMFLLGLWSYKSLRKEMPDVL
ncbi:MAG: ABC transporter permease [Clostridia bacterium]|nr:ABC transporter permease [Clostridia bacterium]